MASNKTLKKIKYVLRFLPDKTYIQLYYFSRFKKFCNFKNPQTFNEKLQWLKLNTNDPLCTKLVDKYEAKKYIADIIGEEYIIPTLGVWDNFDDINFDKLPNQFVLKCTHDSEGLVIVKDKMKLDMNKAREKITNALKQNFYYIGREWTYKDIKPRIIAEKYMEDAEVGELRDYKFLTFDNEVKIMYIASERTSENACVDFYDTDFNHLYIKQKYENSSKIIKKPDNFEKMIELSQVLSKGFSHVRVDFYEVNGKIYFGEMTFFGFSGFVPFEPKKWDTTLGNWLNINN